MLRKILTLGIALILHCVKLRLRQHLHLFFLARFYFANLLYLAMYTKLCVTDIHLYDTTELVELLNLVTSRLSLLQKAVSSRYIVATSSGKPI